MNKNLIYCRLVIISGLFFLLSSVFGQQSGRKFVSAKQVGNKLEVVVSDGTIIFTPYATNAMGAEFIPTGKINPPSEAVVAPVSELTPKLRENIATLSFNHQALSVRILKSPFSISFYYNNKPFLSETAGLYDSTSKCGVSFYLDDKEKLMGGGERVLGMDRRGQRLKLYNQASYGYETRAELMYYSLPVVISSKKYMIAFDNGAEGWLDMGKTNKNVLSFEAVGGRLAYLVVVGNQWPELISNFTALTGRQPMLPRWTLGNIASRMGYHSQHEVESLVSLYKNDQIPLDAVVLDLYWFGKDLKGTLGELDWYRDSFPEPQQMMKKLKDQGVKTILITEPFILENVGKYNEAASKNLFGTDSIGNPYLYDFYFGHTALLDLFKPDTKKWFWDIYKRHTSEGVDGWWGDLGEPEVHPAKLRHINGTAREVHNLYGHEWAKTLHQGFTADFPDRRPVILMRSGFIGSQRFGVLPWSGDVNRSWGGLQPQLEISLQMGMQGLAYMSSDLGGFAGGYRDAELYIRWLQFGVFQPVFRTHAQEEVPSEPVFWDVETKTKAKQAIELRYTLLPYNYTLMHNNTEKGELLMRPLFFVDDKFELLDNTSSYLWGESFLVSPVTRKGALEQEVYLPKGSNWFGFWNYSMVTGGQKITVPLTMDNIPVFVKGGSIIPMAEVAQSTSFYDHSKLKLMYFFDPSVKESRGYLYDDDGETRDAYQKKKYEMFEFYAFTNENETTVMVSSKGNEYVGRPEQRIVKLVVPTLIQKPVKVSVNSKKVKIGKSAKTKFSGKPYAYWDNQQLVVIAELTSNQSLQFSFTR